MEKVKILIEIQKELENIDAISEKEKFRKLANKKYEILRGMDVVELFDKMYKLIN